MPVDRDAPPGHYHGPPSRNHDIVSHPVPNLSEAVRKAPTDVPSPTAFPHRQRRHHIPIRAFAKQVWRQLLPRRLNHRLQRTRSLPARASQNPVSRLDHDLVRLPSFLPPANQPLLSASSTYPPPFLQKTNPPLKTPAFKLKKKRRTLTSPPLFPPTQPLPLPPLRHPPHRLPKPLPNRPRPNQLLPRPHHRHALRPAPLLPPSPHRQPTRRPRRPALHSPVPRHGNRPRTGRPRLL